MGAVRKEHQQGLLRTLVNGLRTELDARSPPAV